MGLSTEQVRAVIDAGVGLLLQILLGYLLAWLRPRPFAVDAALKVLNAFVFCVAIPSLMFKALATRDLDALDWRFVGLFFLLRIIFAFVSILETWILRRHDQLDVIGSFLLTWIGSTWINTVIFGIPMLTALYGPRASILNVLAAISSLIFQLPVMLALFEVREFRLAIRREDKAAVEMGGVGTMQGRADSGATDTAAADGTQMSTSHFPVGSGQPLAHDGDATETTGAPPVLPLTDSYRAAVSSHASPLSSAVPRTRAITFRESAVKVGWRLLGNPPLIGITGGLLFSLIVRMAAHEDNFDEILDLPLSSFAACVTPVAAFCTGMYARGRERLLFRNWRRSGLLLASKAFLLPALTIPFCMALGIDGIEARSAVLIASLPVALAAFTLGQTYFDGTHEGARAGMEVIAVEIIVGSILMPFVFLAWHSILEAGDVFGTIPEGAMFAG